MKYDIVSERIAPTYRISAPADIYGALSRCARFSRTRSESFFPITLNGPTKSFSPRFSRPFLFAVNHSPINAQSLENRMPVLALIDRVDDY